MENIKRNLTSQQEDKSSNLKKKSDQARWVVLDIS